ncbi:MAG TPA: PQQ-binding-like beta-propeller repeat protein, partial [Planctomycetota bacterium]|nr:PQQ-binding-like beta-propeller repeat protein [Planctomycetota bacterium]
CYFPKAAECAAGEPEAIPGKTLPQVCTDVAAAAANAREFTRAKMIQQFMQRAFGEADAAVREQALRALDELEAAAYRFNWMTEAKNPARTGYADEQVELPLKHVGGNRVFVQNSYGIEGLTVADGTAWMGEPFRLGPEPWPITSPPAIHDGVFYGGSKDCNLYACDLAPRKVLWKFLAGGPIYGGPVVYRDCIYFCCLDGKLYALDRKQGRMLWNYPTRDWIEGAPAIDAGRVFIASRDATLYCIDAELGVLRWQHPCDGPLTSTPAVSDGTVFIGSEAGTMFAVEASSGKTRWQAGGNGPIVGAAAGAGRVVFTSADGKLHSLAAADGKPQWPAADLAGPVKAPPIIVGTVAFAGNLNGEVKAVDLQSGTVAWTDTVRFGKEIVKPLAFMDGKLYVPAAGRGNGGYTIFGK